MVSDRPGPGRTQRAVTRALGETSLPSMIRSNVI